MRNLGRLTTATLICVVCVCTPALADQRWSVRGYFGWLDSSGSPTQSPESPWPPDVCLVLGDCYALDTGGGSGFGAGVEYRVTPHRIGIELGAMRADIGTQVEFNQTFAFPNPDPPPDFFYDSTTIEGPSFEVDFIPIYLGANVHVMNPGNRVDVYVGLFYAKLSYGDGSTTLLDEPVRYDVDDDNGWGGSLGFDVSLGKRWFVGGNARYIQSETTITVTSAADGSAVGSASLQYDPFIVTFGGGIRF
jgi:hypothetical protein